MPPLSPRGAQVSALLSSHGLPAKGPAQVIGDNIAASHAAAPALLEDSILQDAIRLRLKDKPNAYALHSEKPDTLVYTKGDARGVVNTKLRDREIKCFTDEGVPSAAATQFIADKVANLQERPYANEPPPEAVSGDDSESLPDMSW